MKQDRQHVYCFVVGLRYKEHNAAPSPSGTLTIVSELIKNWGQSESIFVLCNNNYTKCSFLAINGRRKNVTVEVFQRETVQDKLAKLPFSGMQRMALLKTIFLKLTAPLTTIQAILGLRKYFIDRGVTVVYSHNGGYPDRSLNLLSILAARTARIKKAHLVLHNMPTPIGIKSYPFAFVMDRVIGLAATHIISVSKACASEHEKNRHFGVQVKHIYNGLTIDPRTVKVDVFDKPKWKKDKPVIMFIGSLQPRKGLRILIDAVARMKVDAVLVIYGSGSGEYTRLLKQQIANRGIADYVYFEGYDKNASYKIYYADVLALPSIQYESFGMVILEAMLQRKPVVCSDYGGMKEVVQNGVTGIVATAGNPGSLANALDKIVGDEEKARKMGEAGYRRLVEYFDIAQTVCAYKVL
ncbi:MAG TPA: glycosyltransferase family 1 protein [Chromatiales bacterium]|nr:glycosyltransferase family 1 protein [Chromatiales bacterium]